MTTPHTDLKSAELWRLKFLAGEMEGVRTVSQESCMVNDLLDLVERDHQHRKSLPSTMSRLKKLRPYFAKMRAADLRENHIEAYRMRRKNEGASVVTANRDLEVLRRAFNLGKRATPPLVQHAPYFRMDREENIRTQRITHEQYQALVELLPDAERVATVIGYHVGWRRGKILSLTWDQVDWEGMVIRPPKGQERLKRVGTAPIYGDMQDALRDALSTPSRYVVHRDDGSGVVDMRKAWDRATATVGLEGFRFHDLRSCAVSNLIDYGVTPYDVMQITGHQTDSMLRRYDIVSTKRLGDIGRMMEERRAEVATSEQA